VPEHRLAARISAIRQQPVVVVVVVVVAGLEIVHTPAAEQGPPILGRLARRGLTTFLIAQQHCIRLILRLRGLL